MSGYSRRYYGDDDDNREPQMTIAADLIDGIAQVEMTIEEWNEVLAAINHSAPFNAGSAAKYSKLIEFRDAVQHQLWKAA